MVNAKYRNGISSLHALDEIEDVRHIGLAFAPFSPFFGEFNEQIGRMMSAGFFNFWVPASAIKVSWKEKAEDIGPQVLTMDHMAVALIASLLPLTLAVIAFIAEVSVNWMKVTVPRIRVYFVVNAFYKIFRNH